MLVTQHRYNLGPKARTQRADACLDERSREVVAPHAGSELIRAFGAPRAHFAKTKLLCVPRLPVVHACANACARADAVSAPERRCALA